MNKTEQKKCSVPCNLCGSKDIKEVSLVDREKNYLRTVICKKCGLLWSDPRPNEAKEYYAHNYRLDYKGSSTPKLKHIFRAGRIAIERRGKISGCVKKGDIVLDVGSSGGEFVYLLNKKGCLAEGVEPNINYANYSVKEYGLKIHIGLAQNIDLEKEKYDVITAWHMLEHTENPYNILLKLKDALKPTGILIIELPNIAAPNQSSKHRFHKAHLFNFNYSTLENICVKAGYTVKNLNKNINSELIFVSCQKNNRLSKKQNGSGGSIPGNYEHITDIFKKQTDWKYYTKSTSFSKFFGKLSRTLKEQKAIRILTTGKDILDALFK